MKKFFSFVAAALLSASAFADRATVPNPSDLAALDPSTNAVLCVYFDEQVCNDIVLIGDFCGFDPAGAIKMRPVTGFDGWYAAGVAKSDGSDEKYKPVQLKADGSFAWDFQCGGPDVWVKANPAGADLDVQSELGGAECGLHYTAPGAYIYYCTAWKNHNTPCTDAKDYEIRVYAPECEYVEPTIAGGFDNWADVNHAMDFDIDDEGEMYYYFVMENQLPGTGYKIKGGNGWDNPILKHCEEDDAWEGVNYNHEQGKEVDWQLGTETLVIYRWNDPDNYKYADECEEPVECDSVEYTITATFTPCEGAAPAITGSFNGWDEHGILMTATATPGVYTATIKTTCKDMYKFTDNVLGWGGELSGQPSSNYKFGEEAEIVVDLSGAEHVWGACAEPEAIGHVFENARIEKVIENGQLIIRVDGVRFTTTGARL